MSRLVLDLQVPVAYDRQSLAGILRAICNQVNQLSEGQIQARYSAQSVVPTATISAQVGDIIWDLNTTVRASVAPGLAASYVRLGWVCNVAGTPGTFQELRVLTGA